jgi:hypothetical protein
MGRVILPKRDGEFSLKYDSRLCKRFVADVGDVRVPDGHYINGYRRNQEEGDAE